MRGVDEDAGEDVQHAEGGEGNVDAVEAAKDGVDAIQGVGDGAPILSAGDRLEHREERRGHG
eukprot:7459143-Heterocapsa_arctica.AAC.1